MLSPVVTSVFPLVPADHVCWWERGPAWQTWTRQQQMILKFSLSLSLMLVQQIRHFLVQLHTHGRLRRLSEGGGVVEDIVVKTVVAASSLHGKQVTNGHNKYLSSDS